MTTPAWQAPRNGDSNASAGVNQLLGTHADIEIYDGAPGSLVTAGYGGSLATLGQPGWQELAAGVQIDQPFVVVGSNGIARVEVPLAILSGLGADVTLSLYNDSGGVPSGGALITVTFPKEWLVAACLIGLSACSGAAAPRTNPATISAWQLDPAGTLPAPIQNNYFYSAAQAGNYIVVTGGQNFSTGTPTTNVFVVSLGDDLGPWLAGPSLPQPMASHTMATANGALFVVGVDAPTGATSLVYTATIDSNGVVSGWTGQAAVPTPTIFGATAATTLATGSYVYQIAGETAALAHVAQSLVYWAQATNGNIATWNTGPPLPVPLFRPVSAIVGNQLFVIGGSTTEAGAGGAGDQATTYVATINADGSLNGWRLGPVLPAANSSLLAGVAGNTIVVFGGTSDTRQNTYTLAVGPKGDTGRWRTNLTTILGYYRNANSIVGTLQVSPSDFRLFALGQTFSAALTTTLSTIPAMSVPVAIGGLIVGNTYHWVVAATGEDMNHAAQIHVGSGSSAPGAHYKQGAGAWTAYPAGSAVPLTTFSGVGGRVAHQQQDSGTRTSWMLWNDTTGQLAALGEMTGQIRSMTALQYDPAGVLTDAVGVA